MCPLFAYGTRPQKRHLFSRTVLARRLKQSERRVALADSQPGCLANLLRASSSTPPLLLQQQKRARVCVRAHSGGIPSCPRALESGKDHLLVAIRQLAQRAGGQPSSSPSRFLIAKNLSSSSSCVDVDIDARVGELISRRRERCE